MIDLIIVGGGINGAGIARDAALRGLKVLLLDKGDFGAGTSNASSGFIHGGARYLTSNVRVTQQSCIDSGVIQRIAPHLMVQTPLLYPVKSRWQGLLVESFFSTYDAFSRHRNGKPHCTLSRDELHALLPGVSGEYVGAVTFDEWFVQAHRLVIANLLDAVAHGAEVRSYCEVARLVITMREGKRTVTGVEIVDRLTGERSEISARMVCNATGPWSMHFAKENALTVALRPAKGLHVVIPKRLTPFGVMCDAIDGRTIFFLPHGDVTIIGTTDDDTFELPEFLGPTFDEVAYLKEGVAHLYPAIAKEVPSLTFWGVRPTLYGRGQSEDSLSREHRVIDHARVDSVEGVVSIAGGKLATYRLMSSETTDVICKKLGHPVGCVTAERKLVDAEPVDFHRGCASLAQVHAELPGRLYHRYGSGVRAIEEAVTDSPELGRVLDAHSGLTEAEVRYVIQHEWVRTLGDLSRRTGWGATRIISDEAVHRVVRVMGSVLDWDGEQFSVEANRFVDAQSKAAAPLSAWHRENP